MAEKRFVVSNIAVNIVIPFPQTIFDIVHSSVESGSFVLFKNGHKVFTILLCYVGCLKLSKNLFESRGVITILILSAFAAKLL